MNRVGISFHVSHHLNAFNGQANGFEVWYFAGNETARKLAQAICDEVCKATGWVRPRGKSYPRPFTRSEHLLVLRY
ncbi:MAG: N-acetylmuramoyl-L-alanine amidase [Enterococcus casseliflavus]